MRSRPAVAGALLIALAACNQVFGLDAPGGARTDGGGADGDGGDPSDGATDARLGVWGPPGKIAAAALAGVLEDDAQITPAGDELYFSAFATGNPNEDIHVARHNGTDWETAVPSLELNSMATADAAIHFTVPANDPTALGAYLASNRLGGPFDIYYASRPAGGSFSTPLPVAALNSTADDTAAAPCAGATRFVVSSTRGGASSDLYEIVPNVVTTAIAVANTAAAETGPFLTENCLRLYFASDRDGTLDLYVIERTDLSSPWGEPAKIEELSTSVAEGDPWLSPDERHIVFTRADGAETNIVEAFR